MAQSANKRTPLGIDAFWETPTPNSLVRWEKWRYQLAFNTSWHSKQARYKLAFNKNWRYSPENIILDTLLVPKTEIVELPLKTIYKETIVGLAAQSERENKARTAQQKMNWQNKCQRLIEIGIMCWDKPWPLEDRKMVSLLYLSIGVEGGRILNCKNPRIIIDTLTTAEFWKIVEDGFIRPRNITFDSRVFLITKQL